MLKINRFAMMGLSIVSLGASLATSQLKAEAYTTYHSVPHALRGYYISESANDSMKITQHMVVDGSPLADSYHYHVRKVNYSNHIYHLHSYIDLGGRTYFTLKINHYARTKIKSGSAYYHRVSKAKYYHFLNHFNPEYNYDD